MQAGAPGVTQTLQPYSDLFPLELFSSMMRHVFFVCRHKKDPHGARYPKFGRFGEKGREANAAIRFESNKAPVKRLV